MNTHESNLQKKDQEQIREIPQPSDTTKIGAVASGKLVSIKITRADGSVEEIKNG